MYLTKQYNVYFCLFINLVKNIYIISSETWFSLKIMLLRVIQWYSVWLLFIHVYWCIIFHFLKLYPNLLIDSSFDEYLGFQCFVNKCSAAVNIL